MPDPNSSSFLPQANDCPSSSIKEETTSETPLPLTTGEPESDQVDEEPDEGLDEMGGDEDIDDDEPEDLSTIPQAHMAIEYPCPSGTSVLASSPQIGGLKISPKSRTPPRRKTSGRIKNWCCLKCVNCLADDCGKCINCLDRPKFGGPFIRKQRCLYKKCLMKVKTPQ